MLAGDRFCAHCGSAQDDAIAVATEEPSASPWDAVLDELSAATAGKYDIGRVLGQGGMAAVYLAQEVRLNRRVAIKVMSPSLMMAPGMMERFHREAVTVAGLNHPNIVTIYTVEESANLQFFIMKYIAGPSLEAVIRKDGPLPISVAKAWLTQIGSALGYAHRRGVIHRDIKPANILLDDEGNAIVTDFGIAKVAKAPSLTQVGMTVGTPSYMSPEQCESKEVTAASDQYSLGIVAYEMLTGEPPFTGPSLEIMQAHVRERPRPLTVSRSDCPPDLQAAILRMIEKDPARRWARMEEFLATIGARPLAHDDPIRVQLAEFAGTSAPTPKTPEAPPTVPVAAPPRGIEWVTVSSAPPSLPVGESVQLDATPRDPEYEPIAGRPVTWASSDPKVATVSPTGVVTARRPGAVTVTATCDGRSDAATITVTPPPVASLQVSPKRRSIATGRSSRFRAVARGPDGHALEGCDVRWSSSDPDVAEVSPAGVVTARAPGVARVTATCETQSAAVEVEVTSAAAVSWLSRYWWAGPVGAVAAVILWLIVRPGPPQGPPVASIAVTPATTSVSIGSRVELRAVLRDADGNVLADRGVRWSADNPEVATVENGIVTAASAGTVTITVVEESGRRAASARVTVTGARLPVASLVVEPARRSVVLGDPLTLAARPLDANGVTLGDRPVTWTSSDTTVARVTAEGVVTASALGSVTITARSEGVTGTAELTVTGARVARLDLAPGTAALTAGDTLRLVATARDDRGRPLADRAVEFATSDASVATISADGLVRAVAEGIVAIIASTEGQRTTARLTVRPPPVGTVAVSLARTSIRIGDSVVATAAVTDERGGPVEGAVRWSSSDPSVAQVSAGGVVTALAGGSTEITANVAGRSGSAALTVAPAAPVFAFVAAGASHTCGLSPAGEISCWGQNARGQVGAGGATSALPVERARPGPFIMVATGEEHTCAINRTGAVECWGSNADGRLGSGVTGAFRLVVPGGGHTCALRGDGTAVCWGKNNRGQLGDGTGQSGAEPRAVASGFTYDTLVAGGEHTCGLARGKAYCWGSNWAGAVGSGQMPGTVREPNDVAGGLSFRMLSAGATHVCGLTTGGEAYCWGGNRSGQLGDGSTSDRNRPTKVAGTQRFSTIGAGADHTCALTTAGQAYCWGKNDAGQLGTGTTASSPTPVAAAGGARFSAITAGGVHSCGVTATRETLCWGANRYGQLGDGTGTGRTRPVTVGVRPDSDMP